MTEVNTGFLGRQAKRRRLWAPLDVLEGYANSKQESDDFSAFVKSLCVEEQPQCLEPPGKPESVLKSTVRTRDEISLEVTPNAKRHRSDKEPQRGDDTEGFIEHPEYEPLRSYAEEHEHIDPKVTLEPPQAPEPESLRALVHMRGRPPVKEEKAHGTPDVDRNEVNLDASSITTPSTTPLASLTAPSSKVLRVRPTLASLQKERREKKAQRDAEVTRRKKEEEEERKMTPTEYAKRVQTKFTEFLQKTNSTKLTMTGKAIFYIGGDYDRASKSTRNKMDFLQKRGATVVPTYDPNIVTHIVTETTAKGTLKALGLQSLEEIPMNIPTVTWEWINRRFPMEFMCAAFPSRIDASPDYFAKKNKMGQKRIVVRPMNPADEDYSRIEDFSVSEHALDKHASVVRVGTNAGPSSDKGLLVSKVDGGETKDDGDPLAEFYEQARKDNEEGRKVDSCDESEDERIARAKTSKFTCDNVNLSTGEGPNRDIIDKLQELLEINKTKQGGDPKEQKWRVFAYSKAIRAIKVHTKRIRTYEDAIKISGVGEKTALKIKEIIETGELRRIKTDDTEDAQAIKQFYGIYGVGIATAQKWYANGCRTLDDIRQRKGGIKLSEVQEIGLKYYDDINTRIPRMEVYEIFSAIRKIALKIDPKLFIEVMGSYRRGKATCGDIDILISRPTHDGRTHRGILKKLLKELHLCGILSEDLAIPEDFNDLEQTYRGLCRRDEQSPHRRIDFLCVPFEQRGGALLYYTGDDIFNRAIRYKAKKMGYSLSQRGLSSSVMRDVHGKKLVPGDLIASETEEEIFRLLGVPWQEPHERVRA